MATDTQPETRRTNSFGELEPGWEPMLDDWLRPQDPEHQIGPILAGVLHEYLLSDDAIADAAAAAARRFDDLYSTVYEPRFNGYRKTHKGWTGYLIVFYELLFSVAVEMHYDDPKQDKIIQLLAELRKLPPHAVRIFVQPEFEWVDSEIWTRDPLLPWELVSLEPYGNITFEYYNNLKDPDRLQLFEQSTAYYVNFYAFQARCTAAGFDAGFKTRFIRAGDIISTGLHPDYPDYLEKLDCHVMAAAQYILHAGNVIDAECVKKQLPPRRHPGWKGWDNGNGPAVWKQWGNSLAEIADALEGRGELGFRLFEKNREALTDMVIKARDKMVALEPALFAQPDPEPVADSAPSSKATQSPAAGGNPEPHSEPPALVRLGGQSRTGIFGRTVRWIWGKR
ncbi:hypothetical protein C8A01DRAFT_18713 [Parachaetomium inaequale]|uniref:Uncharacterized protein n=1 Tax=Parachaetomium inaequale TaxID=2588326 RepID=A0AAN6SP76_9PEZI|nr:hypothetical protein C8A01DRAFT_18713 [Parachaetomium inaequale]